MKKKPDEKAVGICGLFCGTCQCYADSCDGCLSDRLNEYCAKCHWGFRTCSAQHGVTWCWECPEFPCGRLEHFSTQHIVNGICHHAHVIEDLQKMKDAGGVAQWVEEQTAAHTCPACGELVIWYESACPDCGKTPGV